MTGRRVLLAYFSRAGKNYYRGGRRRLEVGNTEVLAGILRRHLHCDLHRIEAAEPYSADYDPTVGRKQQADARPAIADPLDSIAAYDTVLLASPIWNVRAPMIMSTFAEGLDSPARPSTPSSRTR